MNSATRFVSGAGRKAMATSSGARGEPGHVADPRPKSVHGLRMVWDSEQTPGDGDVKAKGTANGQKCGWCSLVS